MPKHGWKKDFSSSVALGNVFKGISIRSVPQKDMMQMAGLQKKKNKS